MKALMISIATSLLALGFASTAFAGDEDPGKKLFMEYKCNVCHSVSAADIEAKQPDEAKRGPDLSKLEKTPEADWMKKFLKKEVELEGKKHKKGFTGEDEELDSIVTWLQSMAKKTDSEMTKADSGETEKADAEK